jgi:hypothetical protein
MSNIPMAILSPLTEAWDSSDYALNKFEELIEDHAEEDKKTNTTCRYFISDDSCDPAQTLNKKQLSAIIKTGIIPAVFYNEHENEGCIGLNQHYLHSLEQFYAHCQAEWDKHLTRTDALIGTPAGRIWRSYTD